MPSASAFPYVADLGDGTYRNPILVADYSDPDVERVGDDYWMVASSFNCTPGLPILHSRDLINWTLVGHALTACPDLRRGDQPWYDQPRVGSGVWAPAIRYHGGKFWILVPLVDEGIYVVSATDPRGPWSAPTLLAAGTGLIDPCPFWDEDGRAWLCHGYSRSRSGIAHQLRLVPMAPDCSRLLGEGHVIFDGTAEHPFIEGPKFLKKDGWYYIFAPAGGVDGGWQTCLRSRTVEGPYELKIVLEQGASTINGPHQGAMLDTPRGEWWFLHFQEDLPYGRILHLQPVTWHDGWPVIGVDVDGNGIGEPVLTWKKPALPPQPIAIQPTDEDWRGARPGLQWQWHANEQARWWSLTNRPGHLRLTAEPVAGGDLRLAGNVLAQKPVARAFRTLTSIDITGLKPGARAGLCVLGKAATSLLLERTTDGVVAILRKDTHESVRHVVRGDLFRLRLDFHVSGRLSYFLAEGDGPWIPFHTVRPQAQAGEWISARIGLTVIAPDGAGRGSQADFGPVRVTDLTAPI